MVSILTKPIKEFNTKLIKLSQYISYLLSFGFREEPRLYIAVFLSIFSVLLELLAIACLYPLMEKVSSNSVGSGLFIEFLVTAWRQPSAKELLMIFIALLALRVIFLMGSTLLILRLGKKILEKICIKNFAKITKDISFEELKSRGMGYFITLAGDDAVRVSAVIVMSVQFFSLLLMIALYYIAIFQYSSLVAAMIPFFLLASGISLYFMVKVSHQIGTEATELSRDLNATFFDVLGNIKSVRSMLSENFVVNMYSKKITQYTKLLYQVECTPVLIKLTPVIFLIFATGFFLFFYYGQFVDLNSPFIVTIIVLLMRFLPSIGQLVNFALKIISELKSGTDIIRTLRLSNYVGGLDTHSLVLNKVNDIVFENVKFQHQNSTKTHTYNFAIKKNHTYAIVGPSGSGKTTCIDLLVKFYERNSGNILINGVSIDNYSSSSIRKNIVLLPQEYAIFCDSIENNILFGLPKDANSLARAVQISEISEFVNLIPDGFNAKLLFQGGNLSGGQRQRIGLARAIIRDSEVLILDESTNSLDTELRNRIVAALVQQYKNKILIFITHDKYIIDLVDEVINLEE